MHTSESECIDLYEIFIGMSDKDSGEQVIDTHRISQLVGHVCKGNHVSFSQHIQNGGYYFQASDADRFVFESSVVITLAGATQDEANAIAADLCCFLNQECVMITKHPCERYYVYESLDK